MSAPYSNLIAKVEGALRDYIREIKVSLSLVDAQIIRATDQTPDQNAPLVLCKVVGVEPTYFQSGIYTISCAIFLLTESSDETVSTHEDHLGRIW
ncbi:MAG: hypothetical protein JO317_06485, partial [Verrucomicrobiae bacterium]|nr:hypothetical protein [Verrucomicrobiae bacterium]